MSNPDPSSAAHLFAEAEAAAARGDHKAAFRDSLMALALDPADARHRRLAFSYLRVMGGYRRLPPAVTSALEQCLDDPSLDLQPLAMVVRETIGPDPRLGAAHAALESGRDGAEAAIASGQLSWLLEHRLLTAVLKRAVNIDYRIELVLTSLRRHCLSRQVETSQPSALLDRYRPMAEAIALQANRCRFPWRELVDETGWLATVALDPGAGLITAMYRPVENLHPDQARSLPPALAAFRTERLALATAAERIPDVTTISDPVSEIVGRQYQTHPYPPWDAPATGGAENRRWSSLLSELAQRPAGFPDAGETPVRILIAGCGTGLGAVETALAAPSADIVAFDLSRASLAYAAAKAEQFAPHRIVFGRGDILNIAALGRWFDAIDCTGVLHHMADPTAGLVALMRMLRAGGRIRVGLYSERGRLAVAAAQEWITLLGWRDVPAGIRGARGALLSLPPDHPARAVTEMIDFYSVDAMHDLLFNAVEHRFAPTGIKRMLDAAGLEFLGFELPPGVAADPAAPQGPAARDLDAWEAYEASHPTAFTEMFNFWCRKPAG